MGRAFKHMAIRLWASFFMGSLTALVVLPPLAGAVGPGLMIVPALVLLVVAYWLVGIVFVHMGRLRLNRLIGEAAVWERAGMAREARQALAQAEATVDSFYFSPFSRRAPAGQLLAQLARFQLSHSQPESSSDAVVSVYLHHFPDDREVAVKWLEKMLDGGAASQQTHDIAALIGAAHTDDMAIQRLLAQFYLLEGCCDFGALNAFRQLLDHTDPLPGGMLDAMAELFIAHQRADTLALSVYLKSHRRGRCDPSLLEGIAACCGMVHPTALNQPLLNQAETVLADYDKPQRQQMAALFLPETTDESRPFPSRRRQSMPRSSMGPAMRKAWETTRTRLGKTRSVLRAVVYRAKGALISRQVKSALKWSLLGLFGMGVGWLVVSTGLHVAQDLKPVETVPVPAEIPVSDPFTLQVAAYLNENDAIRFVDQLKKHDLDAYWTRASGSNKTWYQVRISHFRTKADARSIGEDLKNRRLISDYYVANYKRPDVP